MQFSMSCSKILSRRENQPPLWRRALDGLQKNCYTASGDGERIVLEFVAVGGERKAVLLETIKGMPLKRWLGFPPAQNLRTTH